MNGGISDYCCPCSFADGVMLMLTPTFGFAYEGGVVLPSHLLAGITTYHYAFHQ